jgi:hypothetical protein
MVMPDSKEPESKKKIRPKRELCPFVRSPQNGCYFLDMNSYTIPMAVYYCQNHYRQCDIYKRETNKPEDRQKRNDENHKQTE